MHYQSRILNIDGADGFLLAIYHVDRGGEDSRHTRYARFASGRAGEPAVLRDLAECCLLPRPASAAGARRQERMAAAQEALANCGEYNTRTANCYRENAKAMRHAAQLARQDGWRVPRRVYAARNGLMLLGYQSESRDRSGEDLPGVLRLVDIQTGSLRAEWRDVPLRHVAGLASDGASLLLTGAEADGQLKLRACRLERELEVIAERSGYALTVLPIRDGWVAIDHEQILWLGPELQPMAQQPLPRSVMHGGAASVDGSVLALPLPGGQVLLLSRTNGKARHFLPHPGVRRDDGVSLALSDDGQWLATCCAGELAVTRISDGVSWPTGALSNSVHEDLSFDDYRVRSYVPAALGFIGTALLTLQHGHLQRHELEPNAAAFLSEKGRSRARKPIPARELLSLDALLRAARLEAQLDAVRRYHAPATLLHTTALKAAGWRQPGADQGPPLGESRFGGWPDLVSEQPWPTWEGRPMAFLAQINLASAHQAQPGLRLPRQGLLSFFLGCSDEDYCTDQDPRPRLMTDPMVGMEVEGGGAWKVVYEADTARLQRRVYGDTPLPELFEPCAVQFTGGGLALPDENSVAYARLLAGMCAAERDDYKELIGQFRPRSERTLDQLMGYPRLLQQHPPEWGCVLSAAGRDPDWTPSPDDPAHAALSAVAAEWGLLLQLTSNSDAGFMWGDGGHLYFYGSRAAMECGDFSGVWVSYEG